MYKIILAVCSAMALTTASAWADPIAPAEVEEAQKVWGQGIVEIGIAYEANGDYKQIAVDLVDNLYAYDEGTVLFKPTKAAKPQFRLTEKDAVSYFVTGSVAEDNGFALQTWSNVRFENVGIITHEDFALAMGNYFFTDAKTGKEVKVEYTFKYIRAEDGSLLINVHHSSLPFTPKTAS